MINLFDEMSKVLNKIVKHYKSDFEIDKQIILKDPKKYYWVLRECGTDIYDAKNILIKESEEYGSAEYYLTQSRIEAVYEVNTSKVEKDIAFGDLKKISLKNFESIVRSAEKASESEKAVLIQTFVDRYHWSETELDTLKFSLKKRMENFGVSSFFIKTMLESKNVDEVKSFTNNYVHDMQAL